MVSDRPLAIAPPWPVPCPYALAPMPSADSISLRIAIDRLAQAQANHFAIWVLEAPYPGGYVHHDQVWTPDLEALWRDWLGLFSLRGLPAVPRIPTQSTTTPPALATPSAGGKGYTSRLMQTLGVALWEWLMDGPIQSSWDQSLGIAMGQDKPLRLRLDIRHPALVALPWEIMQPQPGRQALSLTETLAFGRTTSAVDPLPALGLDQALQVLVVLGQGEGPTATPPPLQLQREAETLKRLLQGDMTSVLRREPQVPCQVDILVQPTPAQLVQALERKQYTLFFYGGHGVPAPDGGLVFIHPQGAMNGTELAQVLVRGRVKVAVFNACWGAQPHSQGEVAIPRSSLAEVLLHQGVPAVLAMRDAIADDEALSFIQAFARALSQRHPVDRAVAIARQQLLTLYKFNQPAWTLPVLYLHPEFDGHILALPLGDITHLPEAGIAPLPKALLRAVDNPALVWPIAGGLIRVGRLGENDLVIAEPWVSGRHAEIFCRQTAGASPNGLTYYLRDNSRFGTFYQYNGDWQSIHRQEVPLQPGTRLRFGSPQGRLLEFVLEEGVPLPPPSP